MIRVGIIGGSGYTGSDLLRLILGHPDAEVEVVTSRKLAGKKLYDIHGGIRGLTELEFEDLDYDKLSERVDMVFTAVPHGEAMKYVPRLLDEGLKVVDLSADYRLKQAVFEEVYGISHTGYREAVFGLPELHPEVKDASLVANPGCYSSGAILALAPLAEMGVMERVVVDSKSGISGAGAKATAVSHYPNLAQNVQAYKITDHRHNAEIIQEIGQLDPEVKIHFTPHVVPAIRGILTTAHVFLKGRVDIDEIRAGYEAVYKDKFFIRILKPDDVPQLGHVRGSNFCDIGLYPEKGTDRLVVLSALDNMVKGASGAAVQNMNLACGLNETSGLAHGGLFP